jgi:ABC-type multidrug transport system fused ATPase/permease subunit
MQFRFAGLLDVLLILLGTLGAIGIGAALPIHMLLFGNILNIMINYTTVRAEVLPNVIYLSNNCTGVSSSSQNATLGHFCLPVTAGAPVPPSSAALSPLQVELQRLITERQEYLTDCGPVNRSLLLQTPEAMGRFDALNSYFFYDQMLQYVFIYMGIAAAALLFAYAQSAFWNTAAYRQGYKIRQRLFKSLMYQDNAWYDTNKASSLSTRLADDVEKIQSGIGEKAGLFLQYFTTFLVGYVVGFVQGWQLTLVIISVLPILLVLAAAFTMITARLVKFEQKNYAAAGAIAEEVLAAMRTVVAFGGESREVDRYGVELRKARRVAYIKSLVIACLFSLLFFVLFACYALAFGYGSVLILDCEIMAGQIITVFLSVLIGTFSLGQALPELETFASAMGSASFVFKIIDRKPAIVSNPQGEQPDKLNGNVEFKNVTFSYPARDNIQVLNGLSFSVTKGQTLALVGPSGCGKSTTVQLLQRFYDIKKGEVLIDGVDIRSYNLDWLRSKIGIVSQEPSLFATSIAENIRFGFPTANQKDIEAAAKAANAHDFIMALPDKYETVIGSRAAQLSGGQKQRIAIARALVRDPKILLLDEATSALDTESESIVQSALDQARQGRTTIVIAHRLSTIRTANIIASIQDGVVVESGTHNQLMMQNGLYRELVTAQSGDQNDEPLADFKAALERPKKLSFKKKRGMKNKYSRRGTPHTPSTPFTPVGDTPTSQPYTPTPALDQYEVATSKTPTPHALAKELVIESPFVGKEGFKKELEEDTKLTVTFAEPENSDEINDLTIENGVAPTDKKQSRRFTRGFAKLRGKKKDEDDASLPPVPVKDLVKLNLPDWYLVIPGVIAAGLIGMLFPMLAVVFSGALEVCWWVCLCVSGSAFVLVGVSAF